MECLYEDNEIDLKDLLNIVYEMKENYYRLIQICCTSLNENYILNYSFGKDYDFLNYKITIDVGDEVPSISSIFKPAFLYENEMKDLFGVKIKHIDIDYKGNLYDLQKKTPYKINLDNGKVGEGKNEQ